MGWTSNPEWRTVKDAIADECRATDAYDTVWHSGCHFIYVEKATGKPYPTTFLTHRLKGEVYIKDIGEIRGKAMAVKYIKLAEQYIAAHPDDKFIAMKLDEARTELAYCKGMERIKTLKQGDRVYIMAGYTYSGWGIVSHWIKPNRSMAVAFPDCASYVRVLPRMVDVEKTFA